MLIIDSKKAAPPMAETQTHSQTERYYRSPERRLDHAEVLESSKNALYSIASEIDDKYIEHGVDLDKVPPALYWMRVAERARAVVAKDFSTIETLEQGAAIELTAATPYFLLAQRRINGPDRHHMPADEFDRMKYYLCHYNKLIRDYAVANPSVTAHDINEHIFDVAEKSDVVRHPEQLRTMIANEVRGAQHELAAGQVLRQVGPTREATQEEDLQGVDYFLNLGQESIGVDIKSSRKKIARVSHGRSDLATLQGGKLLLYSHVTDFDLNGTFFVSEEIAKKRAIKMRESIDDALRGRSSRRA